MRARSVFWGKRTASLRREFAFLVFRYGEETACGINPPQAAGVKKKPRKMAARQKRSRGRRGTPCGLRFAQHAPADVRGTSAAGSDTHLPNSLFVSSSLTVRLHSAPSSFSTLAARRRVVGVRMLKWVAPRTGRK